MSKNVVAYCRVSTDEQAKEDRFGLESQKKIIEDYCEQHDMVVSHWYVDKGESGVKEKREQLDALLADKEVKNPPVEAVIIAKSDRLARDIKLYYYLMYQLERDKKVELISATEEVVNDDSGLGSVYKSLMLFVAEQERNNITKRTSGGRTIKASKGGYAGGRVPFGYYVSNGKMEIDEKQAEIVRDIFDLRDVGTPFRTIVDIVNGKGYRTKNDKPFSLRTVEIIVGNRKLYEGFYKYGKSEEWVKGEQEAILQPKDNEDGKCN